MTNTNHSLKSQFLLDPDVVFLNHGSFGATPLPVFESYQRWQRELERQPVEFLGRRASDLLGNARQVLSQYLGTQRDNIVFVPNATTGINIVARSLSLKDGDEVLTTDHEYGAMDRTWKYLSKQARYKYINHPINLPVETGESFVNDFWKGVTSRTKVIFISHITSPTALIFPVADICRRAREEGILTVVDGAHAPGQIPLNLDSIGADFYSGNLHKWLCAPKGSAFLFARPEVQHLLEPFIVSWGWESDTPGPSRFVDLYEWTGTRDISPFLAVPNAIQFQIDNHWDRVREECHTLASQARNQLAAITGIEPFYPDDPSWFAQMGSAELPSYVDIGQLKSQLYADYRIEIPLVNWNGKKLIRFSFQAYNSINDLDQLTQAIKKLLL
jgi:isopenicillin-N epimerase